MWKMSLHNRRKYILYYITFIYTCILLLQGSTVRARPDNNNNNNNEGLLNTTNTIISDEENSQRSQTVKKDLKSPPPLLSADQQPSEGSAPEAEPKLEFVPMATSNSNETKSTKINETVLKETAAKNATVINNSTEILLPVKPELKPGAKWRGMLVFGSLGIFAFAYMTHKIYSKKSHLRNVDTSFYPNDNSEFKYGILTDEDNLEMANRPLTMNDSDDEETEIFHQERRKFNNDQNVPTTSQSQVYSDIASVDVKFPVDTSSDDEDLLDLINSKEVLNKSVIDNNNSKNGKTDDIFSL